MAFFYSATLLLFITSSSFSSVFPNLTRPAYLAFTPKIEMSCVDQSHPRCTYSENANIFLASEKAAEGSECPFSTNIKACRGANKAFIVQQYQMQLKRHCPSLPEYFVTGEEDDLTIRTLKTFQRLYGLYPDGIYGPKTAKALAGPVSGLCS